MTNNELVERYRRLLQATLQTWRQLREDMFVGLEDDDLMDSIDGFTDLVFDAVDELHARHDPGYIPSARPDPYRRPRLPSTDDDAEPDARDQES